MVLSKSDYGKDTMFLCTYGNMTIFIRQTWRYSDIRRIVEEYFKMCLQL